MSRNRNPLTKKIRRHLDDQMADTLALGREIDQPTATHVDDVWRAMRVAYCTHFRALLEFFHDGRAALAPNAKPPRPRDILVMDVLPPGKGFTVVATQNDKKRFRMADKLGAHLTRERAQYHAARQEWGNASDRRTIRVRIEALFALQPRCSNWFPRTKAELSKS